MNTIEESAIALAAMFGVDSDFDLAGFKTPEAMLHHALELATVSHQALFNALETELVLKPRSFDAAVELAGEKAQSCVAHRKQDADVRTILGAHDGETTEDAAHRAMKWSAGLRDVLRPRGDESLLTAAERITGELKTERHRVGQVCSWLGINDPDNIKQAIEVTLLGALHGKQAASLFLEQGEGTDILSPRMEQVKRDAEKYRDIVELAGPSPVGDINLKRAVGLARENAETIAKLKTTGDFRQHVDDLIADQHALAEVRSHLVDEEGDYILGAETISDAVVSLVLLHGKVCGLVGVDPAEDQGEAERRLVGLADAEERSLAHEARELTTIVRQLVTMDPLLTVEATVAGCVVGGENGCDLEFRVGNHKWVLHSDDVTEIQRVLKHLGEKVSLRVHSIEAGG